MGGCAQTYTFTTCGATGQYGPSSCSYSGYSVSVSGGIQSWTVPQTGTYKIEVRGAAGGTNSGGRGYGYGAILKGDFSLTAGQILKILVGQRGTSGSVARGGGGGTFVWFNGDTSPLIIAGGGAGENNGIDNNGFLSYSHGQVGINGGYHTTSVSAGYGGAITNSDWAGGGGAGWYQSGQSVGAGSHRGYGGIRPLDGGYGGESSAQVYAYDPNIRGGFGGGGGSGAHVGGGGGGYTGGEGGGYLSGIARNPGGGGSYFSASGSNREDSGTLGYNNAEGQVIITNLSAPPDTDNDGVPDEVDDYPSDSAKVVDLPTALTAVAGNLKLWLAADYDNATERDGSENVSKWYD